MSDQQPASQTPNGSAANNDAGNAQQIPRTTIRPFGEPVIRSVNRIGLGTLYMKEVRRFFKVQTQTIWAPAVTTLLFLVIFTVAMGREGRMVMGVPFATFVAPGLIMMGMLQNSFANSSFSLLVGKIQGNIIDYLMPPLSFLEVLSALIAASLTRAFLVGVAIWAAMLLWPGVSVSMAHPWAVLAFGLLGAGMLAFLGVFTSIWAEKFDHSAAVTNFVVAPLSLLSGTFYSVEALHPAYRAISHANPFFFAISGFRYGFLGTTDSPIWLGLTVLLTINIGLGWLCYALLKSGWKTRA